jgi:hypothetical protein
VRLVVLHYHFLTGGVATVIRQALPALRRCVPEIERVVLAGGRGVEELAAELADESISARRVPAIDYREKGTTHKEAAEAAGKLAESLLEQFGGDDTVWWVHNHHLGKNPVFTQALIQVAGGGAGQRMILHVHDFPEAGRFANLQLLKSALSGSPYPLSPQIRYAVLTPRDREILVAAGVPAQAVHLLANPVPPAAAQSGGAAALEPLEVRRRLGAAFGAEFPAYDPALPLALYPVRTIRRKNVLEACLLTGLPKERFALTVTLPGLSGPEKRYSERVHEIFQSGVCPGLWGIGPRLEAAGLSFEQLVSAADLVVSSSVQEGYGYLFVNALRWRRPLVARELDILEGSRDLFGKYPAVFYRAVYTPMEVGERSLLRRRYLRKIQALAGMLPRDLVPTLEEEVENAFDAELVDYALLPADLQAALLARLTDPGFRQALRRANRELVEEISRLPSRRRPDLSREIERRYGPRHYAEAFGNVLRSFAVGGEDWGADADSSGIQERIVRRFARLEFLRLLYA